MTNTVEAAWRKLLATAGEPHRPQGSPLPAPFAELVRVAYAEPLLRQLYPWSGMWELHFSRCTEVRHTWDIPYIGTSDDGRYYVDGPSRTSPWTGVRRRCGGAGRPRAFLMVCTSSGRARRQAECGGGPTCARRPLAFCLRGVPEVHDQRRLSSIRPLCAARHRRTSPDRAARR
ncbi:DUF6193 family natural product biosynthesis protein [Streptomyces sp. NPDC059897]|uniref:DUF6193 family natural product biosynthesis protein n=1 Tax=Streptomyces sp. NPDC059897 TaxID=3346994 RepID=UPI00365B01A3